jgi:hypothetical protein
MCLHSMIYSDGYANLEILEMEYELSVSNKMRACDRCIRGKRLCMRTLQCCGEFKLALFPLSERFREDVRWDAVEFWLCR